jgi:hypothetical protein
VPFPALKPLSVEDRKTFEAAFAKLALRQGSPERSLPLASQSFAYHYLWRDHFRFRWTETETHLFLFAEYDDHLYLPIPPVGRFDPAAIETAWEKMARANKNPAFNRIENVPEEFTEEFLRLNFRLAPKDPEYLYRRSDLVRLPGDRYKSQRWACNRFERSHRPTLLPYTLAMEPACRDLLERWEGERRRADRGADYAAMLEESRSVHWRALAEAEAIGLTGRVLQTGERIVGYTFGYPLGKESFAVHLEISDLAVTGAAAYLFREFCRELSSFQWINTLDDSGLSNLRRAKEAYRPAKLLQSYIATR